MRFNKLTSPDKEWLLATWNSELTQEQRFSLITKKFGIHRRTVHTWLKKITPDDKCEVLTKAKSKKLDKGKKTYFITWAQNATPVHPYFWKKLNGYAEFQSAEILVIPGRYKNPTSRWTGSQQNEEWWDSELAETLYANREDFHERVTIVGDVKIQPTAVNPLSGMQSLTGDTTSVFGHPRVHLQSLPVLEGHPKKIMVTTGACTLKNYTDSKAGKKGEFHHTYGFVVLEVDGPNYYIRQVTADEVGSFTDLFWKVNGNTLGEVVISDVDRLSAFVAGDIHERWLDREVFNRKRDFMDKVNPGELIIHDLFDGDSVNHHEEKDPIKKFYRYQEGRHLLRTELQAMNKFVTSILKYNPVYVHSNHCDFLDRWIKSMDWKRDLPNSPEYMLYASILLRGEAPKGLIAHILEKSFGDNITCLSTDDSYIINSWETGHHGHIGASGSRGSVNQFAKLNVKLVTAHTHSPSRKDGHLVAGTSTVLRMDYNKGASSWLNADVIIHEDGKAQHLIWMENGKCTIHDDKF